MRDELQRLTGVWYDSVLINYYGDGKCGMRYHVDPLYGVWSPESAVVSIGDTRTFIFREISDYNSRCAFASVVAAARWGALCCCYLGCSGW